MLTVFGSSLHQNACIPWTYPHVCYRASAGAIHFSSSKSLVVQPSGACLSSGLHMGRCYIYVPPPYPHDFTPSASTFSGVNSNDQPAEDSHFRPKVEVAPKPHPLAITATARTGLSDSYS